MLNRKDLRRMMRGEKPKPRTVVTLPPAEQRRRRAMRAWAKRKRQGVPW